MNIKKQIGDRIRKAREEQGISQDELARRIGKTKAAISNYEQGIRTIPVTELPRLAKSLNIPVGSLIPVEGASVDQTVLEENIAILVGLPKPLLEVASELLANLETLQKRPHHVYKKGPVSLTITSWEERPESSPNQLEGFRVSCRITVTPYNFKNTEEKE